jgi:hypothetical protein
MPLVFVLRELTMILVPLCNLPDIFSPQLLIKLMDSMDKFR